MAAEKIEIGDACMIAHGAYISDADWHGYMTEQSL